MKLLLCSDFSDIGYKYLSRFKINLKGKNCLFIGYAQDDEFESESSAATRLKKLGLNLIYLNKDYDFKDKLDMIFARGGNVTRLIDLLREYNQFERIKEMVNNGILYVGNSAGAILASGDTSWTLDAEPYDIDLKQKYGKNAYFGFNFIKKYIFVHCSKYMLNRVDGILDGKIVRVSNEFYYSAYLKESRIHKKEEYIKLGNNQIYFVSGDIQKVITFDWSKIQIKNEE